MAFTKKIMCFGSKPQEDPKAKKNREIERQLREDQKRLSRVVKLLLLGPGESGKSTVLKQMRLIHAKGFATQERKQWKVTIFQNLLQAFQIICGAMEERKVSFAQDENIRYAELVATDFELGMDDPMPLDYLNAFRSLWNDEGVQLAIRKGHEYALHDNLSYYFEDIDRLFKKDYIPTDQDILRARLRTTGIIETIFDIGPVTYRMFDLGGQRSERRKWIHVFDDVQVVIFVAAISGYDTALVEDYQGNHLREALTLFETIANSRYFTKASIIVFLNKIDIFRKRVMSGNAPISDTFPDYTGDPTDVVAGQEFFRKKFEALVHNHEKPAYVHFTNATDTNLLDQTMKDVQDMVVQTNLKKVMF